MGDVGRRLSKPNGVQNTSYSAFGIHQHIPPSCTLKLTKQKSVCNFNMVTAGIYILCIYACFGKFYHHAICLVGLQLAVASCGSTKTSGLWFGGTPACCGPPEQWGKLELQPVALGRVSIKHGV